MDQHVAHPVSRRRCLGLLALSLAAGGAALVAGCATAPPATPTQAPLATPPLATPAFAAPAPPPVSKIGDTLIVRDYALTVLSTLRDREQLTIQLEAQNMGTRAIATSPASFAARTTAGEGLVRVTKAGLAPFDGQVPPGGKLKGVLIYQAAPAVKGIKLYFTPEPTSESSFVVALDEEAEANPFPKPDDVASAKPFAAGGAFKVGDAVVVQGVVLKCLSAKAEGLALTTSYLIYNGGTRTIALTEPTAFDARDASGIKGAFTAAVRATPSLVMPGDTLRVNLSWEFATPPTGIKVSFTDRTLSGDSLVWAIS